MKFVLGTALFVLSCPPSLLDFATIRPFFHTYLFIEEKKNSYRGIHQDQDGKKLGTNFYTGILSTPLHLLYFPSNFFSRWLTCSSKNVFALLPVLPVHYDLLLTHVRTSSSYFNFFRFFSIWDLPR
jgi:hypothetical protein